MSQREAMEKLLQAYNTSLEAVRTFCGEQDADKLSALFTKQEEENFALFNYVNELNNEVCASVLQSFFVFYNVWIFFSLY